QPETLVAGCFAERGQLPLGGANAGSVFSAGSCMWSWGLDDFLVPGGDASLGPFADAAITDQPQPRGEYVSTNVQQITRNAIRKLCPGNNSRVIGFDLLSAEINQLSQADAPGPWRETWTMIPGYFTNSTQSE